MPVTHGGDVHALVPLSVTLLEELLHDRRDPIFVQFKRLGRVAKVSTVDHVL